MDAERIGLESKVVLEHVASALMFRNYFNASLRLRALCRAPFVNLSSKMDFLKQQQNEICLRANAKKMNAKQEQNRGGN